MTAPDTTVAFAAPAKVNLYLHVTGRRPDGYHLLDSLVCFAGVGDIITATSAGNGITLAVDGPFAAEVPVDDGNLVLRAARSLRDAAGLRDGVALKLDKRLPVAAGLGGGSADAAATLRALMKLWSVAPEPAVLDRIAITLGADVPMCLEGRTVFVGGIGEMIDPAPPLPDIWLVLVNPGVALPTPDVFRARSGAFSAPARFDESLESPVDLARMLADRRNDLTNAAASLRPEIHAVLAALERLSGCLLARMCGSGATCYGLFDDHAAAALGVHALHELHPDWWIAAAPVAGQVRTD